MPSFFISGSLTTFKETVLCLDAIFLASLTKNEGVQKFAGKSPKYLTFLIAEPIVFP